MTTETSQETPQEPESPACAVNGCREPARRYWEAPAFVVRYNGELDVLDLCGTHWEELGESVRTAGRVR